MPSANKTPIVGLNQWQGNEYVKRQDLVEDNLNTENKIVALNGTGPIKEKTNKEDFTAFQTSVNTQLGEMATKKAEFKNGSNTFPSGQTTFTITDAFITANTLVTIIPKGEKQGVWSGVSNDGNFVITSDTLEINAVPFDWGGVK